MTSLPTTLSRKAIIKAFDKISPVEWEKLFEREDKNGLAKLRRDGDYIGRTYYETAGLIHWLVRNAFYTIDEIRKITGEQPIESRPRPIVRTHLMVG